MKHLLLFFPALLLLIISCSENEPTEPTTYTDAELKAKIIGTWSRGDYQTINFNANSNFTENVDIDYTVGDSTYNDTYEIKGTYDIIDGIIRYTNITEWNIVSTFYGGGIKPAALKLVVAKNLLYFYPLEILTKIGDDADSLWGEWYTFDWTHKYNDKETFGKFEQTYNFNKDSMTVTLGGRISFDSSQAFLYYTLPLTYNPPEVSWDESSTWIIEFHGGQMYMFYKLSQPPTPLKKEK